MISFRCPTALVEELDSICLENYMERSNAIVLALHHFTHQLGAMGFIEPILEEDIHKEYQEQLIAKNAKSSRRCGPDNVGLETTPSTKNKKS